MRNDFANNIIMTLYIKNLKYISKMHVSKMLSKKW